MPTYNKGMVEKEKALLVELRIYKEGLFLRHSERSKQ